MAKNTANLFDGDPIYKAWYDALEYLAKDTGDRIENAYQESISEFYAHYPHPIRYKRKEYLRRASSGYSKNGKDRKHYRSINNNTAFNAGIRVSDEYIKALYQNNAKYPHITNEWIFWRAFSEGIHGFSIKDIEEHNSKVKNNKKSKNHKTALELGEALHIWSIKPGHIPPVMSPPPESIMNDKFDKVVNHTIMLRKFTRRFNINLRKI